jgi:hypothetical protein
VTRLDEQIAYERVVELRTNLLGHHFWKNHRNEVGLMTGLLAAVSFYDRMWISTDHVP